LPFEAETRDALLLKIAKLPAPAMSAFRREVPAELERIVAKMMMKDPAGRHQTAEDLHADLQSLRSTLLDRTLSQGRERARWRSRRHRWLLAILPAAPIVAAGAYLYLQRASSSRQLTPPPPESRLAVLPFRCNGDGRLDEAFCNGLFELAANRLSELDG